MHSRITQKRDSTSNVQAMMKQCLLMLVILLAGFNSFAQPANDNPCNAIALPISVTCEPVSGTNVDATDSPATIPDPDCGQYQGADVWFKVTVPAAGSITVQGFEGSMEDGAMAFYTGTCDNLTLLDCNDDHAPGHMPRLTASGLTPGATIWVRFWSYQNEESGTFTICATLPPPPPVYITPCTAQTLTASYSCNFQTFTNAGAPGYTNAPDPECASFQGNDVWFKVVVPCEGRLAFDSRQGDITDGGMAIYSGTCDNLTLIECNDDGSDNGAMPYIRRNDLTPGSTIWVRFWGYGDDNTGTFDLCVSVPPIPVTVPGLPPSPNCPIAQPLCMSTVPYAMPNVSGEEPSDFPGGGIYGCLIDIPNPTYYYIQIQNSGSVEFTISQTNTAGEGVDVDFVLWGPFSSPAVCGQLSEDNIVDCSYSSDPVEVIDIPNGVAGEYYILLVTNFGNESGAITYQQTGGTGSSACCTLNATNSGPVCAGSGALINLTSSAVPNATYQWNGPNCFTSNQQNPSGVVPPTVPGTYVYSVTAFTPTGQICSDTTIVTVTAPPALGADKTAIACSGSSVNLTTQFTTTGLTTQWTLGGVPVANPAAVTVSGDYRLIAASAANCADTAIVHVTIDTVNFTLTTANATCTTNGTITVTNPSGIAPFTYNINTAANTYQPSNVFSAPDGSYTIRTKDAQGCIVAKPVTLGFTNNLVVSSVPSVTICNGQSATLTTTSSSPAATYSWSPAAGLSSSTVLSPVANPTESTLYTLTATLGSCTQTTQVQVNVSAGITVSAGPDITLVTEEKGSLFGTVSGPVTSILWTPATALNAPNALNTVVGPFTTAGTYTYTLSVQNALGCTANDQVVVTVVPYCIKVKNAFTPNGDGNNDLWQVYDDYGCLKNVTVHVFNRYGNKVYETRDYRNNWDGRYGGKSLPDGTYYAVIDFTLVTGRVVQIKTDLTILR